MCAPQNPNNKLSMNLHREFLRGLSHHISKYSFSLRLPLSISFLSVCRNFLEISFSSHRRSVLLLRRRSRYRASFFFAGFFTFGRREKEIHSRRMKSKELTKVFTLAFSHIRREFWTVNVYSFLSFASFVLVFSMCWDSNHNIVLWGWWLTGRN